MSMLHTAPDLAQLEADLGTARQMADDGDLVDALEAHLRLVERAPLFGRAIASAIPIAQRLCDWDVSRDLSDAALELERSPRTGAVFPAIMPFSLFGLDMDPSEQRVLTERYVERTYPVVAPPRPVTPVPRGRRVRLGYLSGDIRYHPVMHLGAGLFEHHDRDRFEVMCFSTSPDDGTGVRERVEKAVDRFHDLHGVDVDYARRTLHEAKLDILIDLTGHAQYGRHDLLATRPAPTQVHYLGYPGTTGAAYIDGFVTDDFLSPPGAEAHFTERLVRLPRTYQVNDPLARLAVPKTRRRDHGLPDGAVVLYSFATSYKIEPTIFATWMRILQRVPGAVLWLLESNRFVVPRLRQAAMEAGVDPGRLVFAAPAPRPVHLERLALADICLDTYFVGGHTTASDALRRGRIVVTCPRAPMVSRVAGSLLTELALPELIVDNLDLYEGLVADLATDDRRRRRLQRAVLRRARRSRIFDPADATSALEDALLRFVEDRSVGQREN